jgi:hypothetical protein
MKISIVKTLMIACIITVVAGIPGVPNAINIPPTEVTVILTNQKNYQVKMGCSLGYLMGSVMHSADVDEWVPAGTTIQRTAKHSGKKVIIVVATVYFDGQTFRNDYNTSDAKKVTVIAVPDNLVGSYPKHMKVDIR